MLHLRSKMGAIIPLPLHPTTRTNQRTLTSIINTWDNMTWELHTTALLRVMATLKPVPHTTILEVILTQHSIPLRWLQKRTIVV